MVLKVGMLFDDVESVQEFYMNYAHDIGFSVRIGQQKLDDNGVVQWKRFLCARQGYRKQQTTAPVDRTKKNKKIPEKLDGDVKLTCILSAIVKANTR